MQTLPPPTGRRAWQQASSPATPGRLSATGYRFGGPPTYIEQRGHPRLRMRHAPFAIGKLARDRWVELMNRALEQSRFPGDVDQLLREFFDSTATFMLNRPD